MGDRSQRVIIQRVQLGPRHQPAFTSPPIGDNGGFREPSPFVALEIVTYSGQSGYYLFIFRADGQLFDTWHETLADVLDQAERLRNHGQGGLTSP